MCARVALRDGVDHREPGLPNSCRTSSRLLPASCATACFIGATARGLLRWGPPPERPPVLSRSVPPVSMYRSEGGRHCATRRVTPTDPGPPPAWLPELEAAGGNVNRVVVPAAALAAVALAGCGSSSSSPARPSPSSAGASSAPVASANLNGEQAKPAQQVLADAKSALFNAPSVHVKGTQTQAGKSQKLDVQFQGEDAAGTITIAGIPLNIVKTAGKVYVKAGQPLARAGRRQGRQRHHPDPARRRRVAQQRRLTPQIRRRHHRRRRPESRRAYPAGRLPARRRQHRRAAAAQAHDSRNGRDSQGRVDVHRLRSHPDHHPTARCGHRPAGSQSTQHRHRLTHHNQGPRAIHGSCRPPPG